MKKVLLSLLAVAALVLSCQNYDDEFAALNSKVASLESQISSLAGLQTTLASVQSSVSALQAAVSAIPNLSSEVAAILADLEALATASTSTSADLDALKAELNTSLAALQALIEANSASIANLVASNTELKDALEQLGVDVDSVLAANATFEGNLTITNAAELAYAKSLGGKVATIKGDVYVLVDEESHASGGTGTGLTASEVNSITSQITYVVGNVKVDADAEVDLSKLTAITGDYMVLTHDAKDDALTSVGDDVFFDYDGAYVSNIETADNIYLTHKKYVKASATVAGKEGTTSIDFSKLTKATSLQTWTATSAHTSGASIAINPSFATNSIDVTAGSSATAASNTNTTASVVVGQAPVVEVKGGIALTKVELHYAADYNATTNKTGSAALPSLSISNAYGTLTDITVKAQDIDGAVTIAVQKSTATSNTATVDLSSTKEIGGKLTSDANTNDLSALTTVTGLTLSEQKTVALPALVSSKGTASTSAIVLTEATSLSAPKLKYVGAMDKSTTVAYDPVYGPITADKVEGAISLPALEIAGDLSFAVATSLVAAKAEVKDVDLASSATSIELLSVATIQEKATIEDLKLHGQRSTINTEIDDMAALETLTFVGYGKSTEAASIDLAITSANAALKSLVVGGRINELDVQTVKASTTGTALASVVTQSDAIVHDTHIEGNFDLATLTLGHGSDPYASVGSIIEVIDNYKLGTFSTGVSMVSKFEVTGNVRLEGFNASSITKLPANFTASSTLTVTVTGNWIAPDDSNLETYTGIDLTTTAAAAAKKSVTGWYGMNGTWTPLSAGASRAYGQTGLATLNGLFSAVKEEFDADGTADNTAYPTLTVSVDYKYQSAAETVSTLALSKTTTFDINNDGTGDSDDTALVNTNKELLAELLKIQ